MARLDPRVNLDMYTREAIKAADVWTDSAVRREYSRLRDIAQKRLERLGRNEPESYAYRANKGQYAPARGQTTEALRQQLPQLAKFIAAKTGSVMGIRAQRTKAVASLQAKGYDFVTKENLADFGEFMEDFRSRKGAIRSYGTFDALELWEFAQDYDIDVEKVKARFAQWLGQRRELERYVRKRSAEGEYTSADDILHEFNRLEKQRIERRKSRDLLDVAAATGVNMSKVDKNLDAWMRQSKQLKKFVESEQKAGRTVTGKDLEAKQKQLEKERARKLEARRKERKKKRGGK